MRGLVDDLFSGAKLTVRQRYAFRCRILLNLSLEPERKPCTTDC